MDGVGEQQLSLFSSQQKKIFAAPYIADVSSQKRGLRKRPQKRRPLSVAYIFNLRFDKGGITCPGPGLD